jgi:predicted nucleic acid-binding protein
VAALVDTNILVYAFDNQSPRKQRIASRLLIRGLEEDSIRIPHQAIVEFVAAVSRPRSGKAPLLSLPDACRVAEEYLALFEILYPNSDIVRLALQGSAAYQLSWWDAHFWAYAEYYGLPELISEDFEHDRVYGTVGAVNPFL